MKIRKLIMVVVILLSSITGLAFGQEIALHFQCSIMDAGGMEDAIYFNQLGLNAMNEGQMDYAIDAFTCAIGAEASYSAPYYNRGMVYRSLGNYTASTEDFLMALDNAGHSPSPEHYLSLAVNYDLMGQASEAISYYKQYLELVNEPEAWVLSQTTELN